MKPALVAAEVSEVDCTRTSARDALVVEVVQQSLLAGVLMTLIRLYQSLVAPLLGPCCRFHPSCSHYALGALRLHGVPRGMQLALGRLARCHPFHEGGLDPVPLPRAPVR